MNDFTNAFKQFKINGDFLSLTQKFPSPIPEAITFSLPACHVTLLDSGVLSIEPKGYEEGKDSATDLIISSGIHGNETAPIEIVNLLVQGIIKEEITVNIRLLLIIGNPVAMNINQRFSDENLNRLFTHSAIKKTRTTHNSYEQQRAINLMDYVNKFFNDPTHNTGNKPKTRLHYDLHTAIRSSVFEKFAIYPFQANQSFDKQQLVFLQQCGINTILFSHAPSYTFASFTKNHFNAHSFTIELGKVNPFGENNMLNFTLIQKKLTGLILDKRMKRPRFNNKNFKLFQVIASIKKTSEHFILHVDDDVANFTQYKKGSLLAEDISLKNSPSVGKELSPHYITQHLAEYIVFPNKKVVNGERAALLAIPTTL